MTTDIWVSYDGSLVGLKPMSEEGENWLTAHLPDDVPRLGAIRYCEPRYAEDVLNGAEDDGLTMDGG